MPVSRFSQATIGSVGKARVLLIDNIGMLSALYAYGRMAYIGGGFGKAVHNTLEAAVYGKPVLFGPNNKRFQEIQVLKELGAGIEVSDSSEFAAALDRALTDQAFRSKTEEQLTTYFQEQAGATARILDWMEGKLA